MHSLCYLVAALLIVGCSSQATLTAMEQQQQHNCQTESPSAYEACLEQAVEPYSAYEREHAEPPVEDQATEAESLDETIAAPVIAAPVEERAVVRGAD